MRTYGVRARAVPSLTSAAPRVPVGVLAAVAAVALTAHPAAAEPCEPEAHSAAAFDVMNALADRGLHDLTDEAWNAYAQLTTIYNRKLAFAAAYTDRNGSVHSLTPDAEHSYSLTLTLFAGLRPWRGAEFFVVPELLGEVPLSNLAGLGGAIQNAELQKSGGDLPSPYLSRMFLRQTIDLGGEQVLKDSDPMQLGGHVARRRLVVSVGMFSVLDFLDKNGFAGDLRRQFMNMSFLTYSAYDFAADARGYSWGGVAELYLDDWALRAARMAPPRAPNQLPLDFHLWRVYGDSLEVDHRFAIGGLPGEVRVLGYRNLEVMGRFDDAVAALAADPAHNATTCPGFSYGSGNATAPDLCWVRRPNVKVGAGLNLEQTVADGLGVFFRGMISDGDTEVYSFMSADRSVAFGALGAGKRWSRPLDSAGLAYGHATISDAHAGYLARGGVDGFLGDGGLRVGAERVVEAFYSVGLASWLSVSADYQRIWNPGYNADRGPVTILGGRLHAEM
jgi:hypothetical protein